MNLDDLLNEMSEKIRNRDLSDKYLREHNNSTREEIGIGEYAYGITMIPCEWVYEYLSDYKRVLKENEELLQEKINNQKIIALAQNDMLNYKAGFEDGKNGRTSAVQSIIENQQYYIFQKQIEKYERHIEKLQKENEELKDRIREHTMLIFPYYVKENYIPVEKVKDKIEEYKNMLKTCNKVKDIDRIKAINERILELQELLEGRK